MTSDAKPEFIRLAIHGHLAVVTLDRPPVNAISTAVREELAVTFADLDAQTDVYAVVLTGGQRMFSAGADVKEFA